MDRRIPPGHCERPRLLSRKTSGTFHPFAPLKTRLPSSPSCLAAASIWHPTHPTHHPALALFSIDQTSIRAISTSAKGRLGLVSSYAANPVSAMRGFWGLMSAYWLSESWREAWASSGLMSRTSATAFEIAQFPCHSLEITDCLKPAQPKLRSSSAFNSAPINTNVTESQTHTMKAITAPSEP